MAKNRVLDRREAVSISDLFDDRSIDHVILELQNMLHRYEEEIFIHDKEVKFEVQHYYDSSMDLYVRVERWETDKEYERRIEMARVLQERAAKAKETRKARALARALEAEADERALYEQLKKKFGA